MEKDNSKHLAKEIIQIFNLTWRAQVAFCNNFIIWARKKEKIKNEILSVKMKLTFPENFKKIDVFHISFDCYKLLICHKVLQEL